MSKKHRLRRNRIKRRRVAAYNAYMAIPKQEAKNKKFESELNRVVDFLAISSHRKIRNWVRTKSRDWTATVLKLVKEYDLIVDGKKLNKLSVNENIAKGNLTARIVRSLMTVTKKGDEEAVRQELKNIKDLGNTDARTLSVVNTKYGNGYRITGYENINFQHSNSVPGLSISVDEGKGSDTVELKFVLDEQDDFELWFREQIKELRNMFTQQTFDKDALAREFVELFAPDVYDTIMWTKSKDDPTLEKGERYLEVVGFADVVTAMNNANNRKRRK